jgi:glycosyltransferase involved in cell wall biosynthesis
MDIAHLCLANQFSDGYGYQENMLAKYHKKMGLNVTVLTSQWTFDNQGNIVMATKYDYINEDGVRVIRLPIKNGTSKTRLKLYDNLLGILDSIHPDIIFIHCPQFLNILTVGKYIKKHSSVRAYVDNHSDYSNSATSWVSKYVLHKIIWHFCIYMVKKRIIKFYGVLPARVDFMKELYGIDDSQCELLVMGADDEQVKKSNDEKRKEKKREEYNIESDDFLIVTGGKIDGYKAQTLLLMKAVHNIRSKNIKLLVFGSVSEPLKSSVEGLADGKKVQYIGWIDTNESYDYFAMADLVVFPGRHSVFWEQVVAQGKPMVVKDWKGTHHIDIGGNVIYLREDSETEIESVLRSLIDFDENGIAKESVLYHDLKKNAESEGKSKFLYSSIARKSLEI